MSAARRYRRQLARGTAVFLEPAIPDDAPDVVKHMLATRAVCIRTGVCPECGAEPHMSAPFDPGIVSSTVWAHESGCVAVADRWAS